jgi:hypothetical protein
MEEYAEANEGQEGLPEWLEGLVKVYDKITIKVSKK